MSARRAMLYCTVNGVCNNTNGLGRQTKTLLSALEHHRERLTELVGEFDVHLACPRPGPETWGYDPSDLAMSTRIAASWRGGVHELPYDTDAEFWSVATWRQLSDAASRCVAELVRRYDELIVIAVDTPFAGLGESVAERMPSGLRCRVDVLLAFYSTALIVERPSPSPSRIAWERRGVHSANTRGNVWVADIGQFLTRHLRTEYGLRSDRIVPYASSVDLASADLQPMPEDAARNVVDQWNVPRDRPLVAAFGRTDPTKGIDLLIHALGPLRDEVHAVIVAVPFHDTDPLIRDYRKRIDDEGLRATLVAEYTRELPRALCALPETRAVVCPSRGETLANVPFEVALWARHAGPVVVAPRRDGFVEQIDDGRTGVLYDPGQPDGLTQAVRRACALPDGQRAAMRAAAECRVRTERDVAVNFPQTLEYFWRRG